jgi:deoxyribonuclease-4
VIEVSGGGERLGVCLDSCHLLASGYEVRKRAAFKQVVDEYDRVVGLDRLRALHLNDSKTALGSNVDRHATLGDGEIGEYGLRVFLSEKRFKGLPVLLETGPEGQGPDKAQVDLARRLCSGRRKKRA